MEFLPRHIDVPNQSFYLFGPRGTGKSAWVKHFYPNSIRIDLLRPDLLRHYQARPERLRDIVASAPSNSAIVIDEVQRVPELLSVVHGLIEEKRGLRFVLTGSSARKLRKAGVDLMGGRAVMRSMHPFMAAELGARFNMDTALRQGMLPLVWDAENPEDTLRSYIGSYIREEVQAEGMVRHLSAFSRFVEVMSLSHAQVLNIANIARECATERKTVEGFISVLEDLLIAYRLPVFTKRAGRSTVSHPKFYYFDCGVFRTARPAGPLDHPEGACGVALEGLVAQHLRAWIDFSRRDHTLHFWRTRAGSEVDFVVYGPRNFMAIEVKHADHVHSTDLRGLKAFHDDYPEAERILVYRGSERLRIDGVDCIPCQDFLFSL
jgi:predicted AAA+ superfamily ATPase